MSTGNLYVKLFYRIFPCEGQSWEYVKIKDRRTIYARKLQEFTDFQKKSKLKLRSPTGFWEFNTDGVFLNSTQTYVYSSVAEDLLRRIEKGCIGIIIAFGQTGTGKTLTLGGLELTEQDLGVIPQMLRGLFDHKKSLPSNLRMSIHMSLMEFTPTTSIDLLKKPPSNLGTCQNRNATRIRVKSMEHALELLYLGEGRREVIETEQYTSHVNTYVVTIHVVIKNVEFTDPFKITSRFHIIDMAGCDVPGKPSCSFKARSDVARANLIKMGMEQFFLCLMSKTMVCDKLKERMNPLLYYLDGDLASQSEIRFIGHIKINKENLPITLSMLRFGQFVKGFSPAQRTMLPEQNDDIKLELLEHELERMKKEKMQDSVLLNQNLGLNLNQDRVEHIERLVMEYIKSGINEISILNVAEASVVFKVFRDLIRQCEAEKKGKQRYTSKSTESIAIRSKESLTRRTLTEKKALLMKKQLKKSLPDATKPHVDKGISVQSFLANQFETMTVATSAGKKSVIPTKVAKPKRPRRGRSVSKPSKSIASDASIERFDSMLECIPETIPDSTDIWEKYLDEPMYRSLNEDHRLNEIMLRDSYKEYLDRINKLQDLRDIVEERRNDLTEAKMFKKLSVKSQPAPQDSKLSKETILHEAEELCESELRNKILELEQEQEEVLKLQSLIKLFLMKRKEVKKQMNSDFLKFCQDKYGIPMTIPENLEEEEELLMDDVGQSDSLRSLRDDALGGQLSVMGAEMLKYKKLLMRERKKSKAASRLSKISWK